MAIRNPQSAIRNDLAGWLCHCWYELVSWLSLAALTLGWSLRIRGRRHFPRTGPVLVIANHQSFLDPLVIGVACSQHLSFLARKTLFANRLFGWLIGSLGGVPIDQQGVGKEGLQTVLRQLDEGRAVVVFPEGHRTRDGVLHALMPGIVLLLKRARAPLVPVAIAGAHAAWPHGQKLPKLAPLFLPAHQGTVAVAVGPPFDPSRWADDPREKVLEELFTELMKVQEQAERLRRK